MVWIKYPLPVATFAVVLSLELLISPGCSTQKQENSETASPTLEGTLEFQPPNRGAPPVGVASGSRSGSGSCIASSDRSTSENKLTALVPNGQVGLTVSDSPKFFLYIPQSSAKTGEFTLMDQNQRLVYRTSLALPTQSGIVSISLPANRGSLEVNKMYRWSFQILCDSDDRSDNPIAGGWIERIQPNQTLANQIRSAPSDTLPSLYAGAGIWQDALAKLVELRRSQPNNTRFANDWKALLNSDSVKLGDYSQKPLLNCCQPRE